MKLNKMLSKVVKWYFLAGAAVGPMSMIVSDLYGKDGTVSDLETCKEVLASGKEDDCRNQDDFAGLGAFGYVFAILISEIIFWPAHAWEAFVTFKEAYLEVII